MLRWALPVAFLVAEYLALSFVVDLPTSGPAMGVVEATRIAVPVAIGAAAAAWLLEARRMRQALRDVAESLPPWRPWPALLAQLAAFALTLFLADRLLGAGATPITTPRLLGLLACALTTVLLALASAAPLRWTAHLVAVRWRIPLLALAVGLLSWRTAAAAEGLWGLLSEGTLRGVAWLTRFLGFEAVVDPAEDLIAVGGFAVRIAPVCSGVDGVGLVVLFQALWISMARSRLRVARALLLLPLGAIAALAANVVRLATLVLVGAAGQERLAVGGLHSKLGWILFVALALASVALAERTPWLQRPGSHARAEEEGLPPGVVAYLAPLLAALVTALVAGVWSDGSVDLWYGARIAAALAALALVRRDLPRLEFSPPWFPLLLAAGICAIWIAWGGADGGAMPEELVRLPQGARWSWIAVRVFGSCLVIPLVEELAFRGFLLPWLASADFEREPAGPWTWPAVLLSSLAFGVMHQRWLLGSIAGLAFAAARLHRGRLGDAVLAHALCNAGIAAAALLGGRWDLWS